MLHNALNSIQNVLSTRVGDERRLEKSLGTIAEKRTIRTA